MHKSSPAKIWRKFGGRYKLNSSKCTDCQSEYYPEVKICTKCFSEKIESVKIEPSATLISWTLVNATLDGFEEFAPIVIAIIELKNRRRLTTQLVDVDLTKLSPGIELHPTFRKIYAAGENGVIHYGLKYTL